MKTLFCLALILGLTANRAAATSASTNAAPAVKPPMAMLDHDDETRLMKVRSQVLSTHPELKTEEEKLKAMHDAAPNGNLTAEQKESAKAEWLDYQSKVRAEMLKIDPTLKPLFAKIDKARAAQTPPASAAKPDHD